MYNDPLIVKTKCLISTKSLIRQQCLPAVQWLVPLIFTAESVIHHVLAVVAASPLYKGHLDPARIGQLADVRNSSTHRFIPRHRGNITSRKTGASVKVWWSTRGQASHWAIKLSLCSIPSNVNVDENRSCSKLPDRVMIKGIWNRKTNTIKIRNIYLYMNIFWIFVVSKNLMKKGTVCMPTHINS